MTLQRLVGFVLFLFGLAVGGLDVHVAWLNKSGAHWLNMGIAAVFVFAGLAAMFPQFASVLFNYFIRAASSWPGGSRRTDPPSRPDVPPPPSVKER